MFHPNTEKWSEEDKERMSNLLEGMTEWINKYASVLDDPDAAIPTVIKQAPIEELPEEQVVELDPIEETKVIVQPLEIEELEKAVVPPEIHTEGFVVFANSPDTQRFSFSGNLKNFGNISITVSSFDSRHPEEANTVHKSFDLTPGQALNMEMPEMEMPEVEMPEMAEFISMPEIRMPPM